MGSKKLVWCCIVGIVLGFLAPLIFGTNQQTSLMVGLVAGLGVGYLLDSLDEKKSKQADTAALSRKAREANRLLEQARAEVEGRDPQELSEEEETGPSAPGEEETEEETPELTVEEQTARLTEAEELLRKARERMNSRE